MKETKDRGGHDRSGHPVNMIANGLRELGIGILDVERSAASGILNFMRDFSNGSMKYGQRNYLPQKLNHE